MSVLKKLYLKEKKHMKDPGTVLAVWMAVGVVIGIGMDNIGAGIAVGVAIGAAMASSVKKNKKEETVSSEDVTKDN